MIPSSSCDPAEFFAKKEQKRTRIRSVDEINKVGQLFENEHSYCACIVLRIVLILMLAIIRFNYRKAVKQSQSLAL